jgi:hypothetical protein
VRFLVRLEAALNHRGRHDLQTRLLFKTGRSGTRERSREWISAESFTEQYCLSRCAGKVDCDCVCEGQRPRRLTGGMAWNVRGWSRLQPGSPHLHLSLTPSIRYLKSRIGMAIVCLCVYSARAPSVWESVSTGPPALPSVTK